MNILCYMLQGNYSYKLSCFKALGKEPLRERERESVSNRKNKAWSLR